MDGTKAKFYGVYKVNGQRNATEKPVPQDFDSKYPHFVLKDDYYYELERMSEFEDYKNRIIIDWGKGTRSWDQWLRHGEKEVIEILPKGYVKEFPGYPDPILDYNDMVKIINNPDANREWHKMLSSVAGVYLITDMKTGKHYVGSAYGDEGILGRWKQYAKDGHGGNVLLIKLIENDIKYSIYFQFSILHIMTKTSIKDEVLKYEKIFKDKLGSRAFGLNGN